MALTNFSLTASNSAGPINYILLNDPSSGQFMVYPSRDPVVLSGRQARLTIIELSSQLTGYSDLNHLLVTIDTYNPAGAQIGHSQFIAGNDPYIDVASIPNSTRYVSFTLYHPPIPYTKYQLYCSDDVSAFGVTAGDDEYVCTADSSPLVFNYTGDVTIHDVKGPSGEACDPNKVDITADGETWLMSDSSDIPENAGGMRAAFVRYFGIPYTAYFRSITDGLAFSVFIDGVKRANVTSSLAQVGIIIHSNEEVTLSGFTHPTGYGRPWKIFADTDGSWQDSTAEQTGGSYKLWFKSRHRRVQAAATKKEDFFFYWWSRVYDPVKIQRKKFFSINMMALTWNKFCQRCYDVYRLWDSYPGSALPTVSSGDELTADIFNAGRALVSGLPGAGELPPAATSGQVVKASYFEGAGSLKAALNAAIEHYMDTDD